MKYFATILIGFVSVFSISANAVPTSIYWADAYGRTSAYEKSSTSPSCDYSDNLKNWTYSDSQTKAPMSYSGPSRMIVTVHEYSSPEYTETLKLECVEVLALHPVTKSLTTFCEMIKELPQQCVPREF